MNRTGRRPAAASASSVRRGGLELRTTRYSVGAAHGAAALPAAADLDPHALAFLLGEPDRARGTSARDVLFLDTETMGLESGPGALVFLVGLAWIEPEGPEPIRIEQTLLESPEHERAFLAHVAARVRERPRLVTFSGKSFDRHRLDDRFALWREPRLLTPLPHLDLLHLGRRLLMRAWPDGKLRTFERRVLDLDRGDDLPGAECPAAWLASLEQRGDRAALERVFEHNRIDVLSLIALAARVVAAVAAPHDAVTAAAAARLFSDRGEPDARVEPLLERAAASLEERRWIVEGEVKRAVIELARRRRARGELRAALDALERLARAAPSDPEPVERALPIAEEDLRDVALARELALDLRRRWLSSSGSARAARGLADVNRTIERLSAQPPEI